MSGGPLAESNETTDRFRSILESNGITQKVSHVLVKDAGLKGEGFCSETYCVTVNFESDLDPLHLFVKGEIRNSAHADYTKETRLFEKESTFFTKYVPAAKKLCQSKGLEHLLDIYPKCYYADPTIIVLENAILQKGFAMNVRSNPQGFESACLALQNIAIHHAISHAILKDVGPKEFFKLFPNMDFEMFRTSAFQRMMEPAVESEITNQIENLEKSNVERKDEAIEILKNKSGKAWEYILGHLDYQFDDKFLVLSHGDYHNNNMMFRKDSNGTPVAHIIVDFQVLSVGSLALDISKYLYSSVDHEMRRNKLHELLTIYLNTFNSTTEKLGKPTNLGYDEFFQIYCDKLGFGLWSIGLGTVSTAALIVIKDIDVTKIDMTDFGKIHRELVLKWNEEHPDIREKDERKLVAMLMEYKDLALGK